jgi:DNA-binding transcriptional LysR family regulator
MGGAVQWEDRIGRRLKLRDLHIFMSVAQQGSMGRAAKHLAVSQPVVSKAIADLEHTLGVRLFDRTTRGAEVTAYGGALLRWGTVVFDDLRRSIKEIEFLADPAAGEVRVASMETMNASFVPAVLDRLSRQFPRLVYYVLQASRREELYKMLNERSVDLAVLYRQEETEHEDLNVDTLFSDSLSVVAGADSQWVRRRKIDLAEIVDEPWCLPLEGTLAASVIARAFHDKGLAAPRRVITTNSVQLLQTMAASGRVLSFASRTRLRLSGSGAQLKALPVALHVPYGSVGIVTLKSRTISPAAQLFVECARGLARLLAAEPIRRQRRS